jgi:CheY-like chemotaxis protein
MGGEITLESQPELGTSFRFTISLKKTLRTEQVETAAAASRQLSSLPEANPVVTSSQTPMENHRGHRILLVEDNATNQLLAVAMLENLELEVSVVGNGREAVTAFESETFHVILMDCQMPEMDGFEATRAIRSLEKTQDKGRSIPIIALTANAFPSDRERCLAVGMNDYLAKPFTIDQLKQKLEMYLSATAAAEQPASAAAKIVA